MNSDRIPSFCPYCEFVMKGSKSTTSWYNYGCCSTCFIYFIEGREQRWKDGWRPSETEISRVQKELSGG